MVSNTILNCFEYNAEYNSQWIPLWCGSPYGPMGSRGGAYGPMGTRVGGVGGQLTPGASARGPRCDSHAVRQEHRQL